MPTLLLALLSGCPSGTDEDTTTDDESGAAGLPDCGAVERDADGVRPDCVEDLATSFACATEPDSVSQEGLIFAGYADVDGLLDVTTITITDAASWEELRQGWLGDDPTVAVDFETHLVVIVQDYIHSSCQAGIESHGVWDPEPAGYAPRVYVRYYDDSGSCGGVCSMAWPLVVAYQVPRAEGYPVVCADVVTTCDV